MILLLTDKPSNETRLPRVLEAVAATNVVDLLDPEHLHGPDLPRAPCVIVSDVAFSTSTTIAALRRQLNAFGSKRPPFVCLLREDTPRARAQAHALQADHVLDAQDAPKNLPSLLATLMQSATTIATSDVSADVAGASAQLKRIFALGRSSAAIEPQLIQSSARFINEALHERTVGDWLEQIWLFDDVTHQHCLLVAVLAAAFGRSLGMRRSDCELLTQGGLLHDVGKCRIPVDILRKPGRLDAAERLIVDRHPADGYAMLVGQGYGPELLAVVRSHHELLDGSGYPDRLAGREIPDLVRLVTICDIFAALIERRSYKAAIDSAQAIAILESMTGKLDGDLVRAFRPVALGSSGRDADRSIPAARRLA